MQEKERQIRASFDDKTITVYQAYRKEIALPAVKYQKFVSPFKVDRMTWTKPSFLWMMYRCSWVQKEGQELIPKDIEEAIKLLPRESVYES